MKFATGTKINDRYTILSKIGEGGFASVYRAHDDALNRDVALKVLNISSDPENGARFLREAKFLAGLTHKNIVSVFAFELISDSIPIIVMEYLIGRSLQSVLIEREKIDSSQLIEILRQACEGLSYLHAAGIVHRDLSTANILLLENEGDYSVKLLDFGLSKSFVNSDGSTDALTRTGLILGNPPYMSPEAASGNAVDIRSDLYSLGCIIYECLSGRRMFDCDTSVGIIYKQIHDYPPAPVPDSKIEADVLLSNIALRCLQKEAEKRFQSCEEILRCLDAGAAAVSNMMPGLHGWDGEKSQGKNNIASQLKSARVLISCIAVILIVIASALVYKSRLSSSSQSDNAMSVGKKVPVEENVRIARLLAICKNNPEDLSSLSDLGTLYYAQNKSSELESLLRDFINREERAAKKSPLLAKHYLFLASAYQRQNKFGPAKAMALKSLRLMESYVASDSPELISIVIKIGQLSEVLGQYDEAARFYKRALLICQKDSGLESPALVPILTDLGQAYFESGNIREAEPIFLRALKIADKSMAKDEPAKDWILAGLMSIRISQKRYKDAETLAKQLLDRREKRASSTHAGSEYHYPLEGYVVVSLAALAHVYTLEGRDSDATPLLERAVALHEKAFAESVDQTGELDVLNQLALNYRKLGRKEEASKLESYSEKIKSKLNQNNAR